MDNLDVCFTTFCVVYPFYSPKKAIHRQNIFYFVLHETAIDRLDVILSDVIIIFYCGGTAYKSKTFF